MRKCCSIVCAGAACLFALFSFPAAAQIRFSNGAYTNNFDSLGTASTAWTNNLTLPGWYASKGGEDATNYIAGAGTGTAGGIYSFGTTGTHGSSDRALGSLAGSSTTYAFGVRFTNDTASPRSNLTVSCTGEQWRTGSTNTPQALAFSWQVADVPITNTYDGANWSNFPALDFISPNLTANTAALDGNATTNRQVFSSIVLTGVVVDPGQELFLRWLDVDDVGSDNALAIDDLAVTFSPIPATPPYIITQPQSQTVTEGDNVTLTITVGGTHPLSYQWHFFGTNLAVASTSALSISNVTAAQAGSYFVVVTNAAGATNSQTVTLTVEPPSPAVTAFSLLTYNVKGNGTTDWSTNAPQVQAIARVLQYLNPDIITFNEIPFDLRYEMTNFIAAFLPGHKIAISTGTDGSVCSAIASRYSITRSNKWLDGVDLRSFGYSNANNALDNFTRDLYEAEIAVPGFPHPMHVFTTHLKSTSGTTYADAAAKRAAEAAAITNFFATNLFVLHPYDPYTLSGDMNESDTNSLAIQRLVNGPAGLRLTNPTNPVTGSINTYSIQASVSERIDFIFPSGLLASNIATSQVFRSDRLSPLPLNLFSNDSRTASDHLPVMMVFKNPYDKPFRFTAITRSNPTVTLQWQSVFGQPYRVDSSSNLVAWSALASNLTATGTSFNFVTNVTDAVRFFRIYRVP